MPSRQPPRTAGLVSPWVWAGRTAWNGWSRTAVAVRPRLSKHMFDPFYSGRQAGRGRGLGLPTAWQLARIQGGDVRFEGSTQGRTHFVLSLPGLPQQVALSEPTPLGVNGKIAETNGHARQLSLSSVCPAPLQPFSCFPPSRALVAHTD